jgi:carbon monoxide dehydrogenase subunit G
MTERTEGSIEIEASPQKILAVIAEFETYPEWVDGVRSARVTARDDDGRGTEVDYEFSAMGFSASYTLRYEYADGGTGVSWTTVRAAGAIRDVSGEYVLDPLNGDTEVTYRLAVELNVPVPGFLKRRADRTAIRTALEGLKKRVEG